MADLLKLMLDGDNKSFDQANTAYFKDQNYKGAIKRFQAAIEYERLRGSDSLYSVEVIVKSIYWMGECYLKMGQIDQALEMFEQFVSRFSQLRLASDAQQQVAAIREKQKQTLLERLWRRCDAPPAGWAHHTFSSGLPLR